MKKTYHGSCHCGAVRFSCELDLDNGTTRCNCSICSKTRFWLAVAPAAGFELLSGQAMLADYQFGQHHIHHRFCRQCGVKTFGQSHRAELGGDFYAVNMACLDDISAAELAAAPVQYTDGRHDNWGAAPSETAYL